MIMRRRHTANFTTIGNELFDDERLKADEVGILAYLLSRPNNWEVRRPALMRRWDIGPGTMKRIVHNWMRTGWCQASKIRLRSGHFCMMYDICDQPGKELTDDEIREALSLVSSEASDTSGHELPENEADIDDSPPSIHHPLVDQGVADQGVADEGWSIRKITNTDSTSTELNQKFERELAREREKHAANLVAFKRRWPTAASDDQARTDHAWFELQPQEGDDALAGIGPFIAKLKSDKRTTVPAGWKYLKEKRWTLLAAAQAASAPIATNYPRDSREARAILALFEIGGVTVPRHRRRSDGSIDYNHPVTPQLAALAEIPDRDAWVVLSRQQAAAWEALLREVLTIGVRRPIREGQPAPWPWPPGKDGKLYTGSTGPPLAGLSDQELADFK